MALAPKLKLLVPQDATKSLQLDFQFSGNQVYANRIIIRDNSTNSVVYDVKTSSYQLYSIVPANTLQNGKTYNIQCSVFDVNDVESPLSQPILFQALSTPVVTFTNLISNQIIRNSTYTFTFSYAQAEGELLSEYSISLYDENQNVISTTGILTDTTNLAGTLSGFLDNTQYLVRISIKTVNNFQLDTDYVLFSVEYISPTNYGKLVLENNKDDGNIKISSNVTLINGDYNNGTPTYVNGEKIDLTINKQFKHNINNHVVKPFVSLNQKFVINELDIFGKTIESGTGNKSSINPFTYQGTKTFTITHKDNTTNTYTFPRDLYSQDVYSFSDNTLNNVNGSLTYTGAESWKYDANSLNNVSGTSLSLTDAQNGGEFTKINISGHTNQVGSGYSSPTNVRTISGVTKVTVNGTDYASPRILYDGDSYDFILGKGTAINALSTYSGASGEGWTFNSFYNNSNNANYARFQLPFTFGSLDCVEACDKIPVVPNSSWEENSFHIENDATNLNIVLPKSYITNWSDAWTDSQKVTAFKSWLASNHISFLYRLATSQTITGTAKSIATTATTTVTNDLNSKMDVSYINQNPILYTQLPFSYASIETCSHYNVVLYNDNFYDLNEGIAYAGSNICVKTLKSSLPTPNLSGFKSLLTSSNLKLIYTNANPLKTFNVFPNISYQLTDTISVDNGYVDLNYSIPYYEPTDQVTFSDGFNFSGDVTKEIIVDHLLPNTICWQAGNGKDLIILKYMLGKFAGDTVQQCYFLLIVQDALTTCRFASQPMDILSDSQQVAVLIQRKSNSYQMSITLL